MNKNFGKLWLVQASTGFRGHLTAFALPLIAVVAFDATPIEVGYLVLFREVPVVLFSLAVGVWLDRSELRRALAILLTIELVWLAAAGLSLPGFDNIYALYAVASVLGITQLSVNLTTASLLPTLVEKSELVEGNSRIRISNSIAGTAAPVVGGVIAKNFFPVWTLAAAALGTLAALWATLHLPKGEKQQSSRKHAFGEIAQGFRTLFEERLLRSLVISSCVGAFSVGMYQTLLAITAVRVIGVDELSFGLLIALGSSATVVAAFFTPRLSAHIGTGRALIFGNVITSMGFLVFAASAEYASIPSAIAGIVLIGVGTPMYGINQMSVRQAATPPEQIGRVNASRQFVVYSFVPLGALVCGYLAEQTSIPIALLGAALLMWLATVITLWSPLRKRWLWFESPSRSRL